jgi:hypothetical protein
LALRKQSRRPGVSGLGSHRSATACRGAKKNLKTGFSEANRNLKTAPAKPSEANCDVNSEFFMFAAIPDNVSFPWSSQFCSLMFHNNLYWIFHKQQQGTEQIQTPTRKRNQIYSLGKKTGVNFASN